MTPTRTAALGLAALFGFLGVAGGIQIAGAPLADAHDFSLQVNQPACDNGLKKATVIVTNGWDTDAKVFTAQLSGSSAPIAAHSTYTVHDTASGSTTGKGSPSTVRLVWPDGVSVDHSYQINWGSGTCNGAPTTTTTVSTQCKPGEVHSDEPPVGCYPVASTVPTTPPATNPEPPTTVPVVDSTPPVTPPTTNATPTTVRQGPPRIALPETGAGEWLRWVALGGVLLLMVGVAAKLVIAYDRRKSAREAGARIVLADGEEWPSAK